MKKILFLFWWFATGKVQAQNNPIFNGGTADGWSATGFSQSPSNIFQGGAGDGWDYNTFQQTPSTIFNGGEDDGWAFATFLQQGNAIFNGNNGDGWSYNNFLQAGNSIFNGGEGDGWASTYRPLGVLPVTLLTFSAKKSGTTSLLNWQTFTETGTLAFDVERSSDAIHFTKIGVVAATGNSTSLKAYQFTDGQPMMGTNYYRLKQVDRNGAYVYTPTRMVLFDDAAIPKLKVYPVPTTTLLTVELPQQLQNENVVLNLSNALGVMVRQVKLYRNTFHRQVLDLSTLPAGVYTLQLSAQTFHASETIIKQ